MNKSDVTFSNLKASKQREPFISFPATSEAVSSSPSARLSAAFTDLIVEEHGEDFYVNYVLDEDSHPWLAVTETPDAVEEHAVQVGLYDDTAGHINSTHFCRLLSTQWGNGEDETTTRLYYAREKEPLGDHWTLYRLEAPSE